MKTLEETIKDLEYVEANIKIMKIVLDSLERKTIEILDELNTYAVKE